MFSHPHNLTVIDIRLVGDGAFSDVEPGKLIHTTEPMRVAGLAGGMASGKPSVGIGVFLPNGGGVVVGETSLALFLAAADALRARYGDPRKGVAPGEPGDVTFTPGH